MLNYYAGCFSILADTLCMVQCISFTLIMPVLHNVQMSHNYYAYYCIIIRNNKNKTEIIGYLRLIYVLCHDALSLSDATDSVVECASWDKLSHVRGVLVYAHTSPPGLCASPTALFVSTPRAAALSWGQNTGRLLYRHCCKFIIINVRKNIVYCLNFRSSITRFLSKIIQLWYISLMQDPSSVSRPKNFSKNVRPCVHIFYGRTLLLNGIKASLAHLNSPS